MTTPKEAKWISDLETLKAHLHKWKKDKDGFLVYDTKESAEKYMRVSIENSDRFVKEENKKITKDTGLIIKKPYKIPEKIKKLLDSGKLWDKIVIDELNRKHVGDIKTKEIIFLCFIGRFVKNKKTFSFNNLVLSVSSAGKDHLVGSVLKLFPKEDYEIWGRTSTKTFNYLHNLEEEPDFDYNGRIVYLKEITEGILNSEVMKEFTSSEEQITQIAIPKQRTKLSSPGVDVVQIRGHPVVISTTATSTPSDEIRNRFNIVGLDETEEQTKRARKNITEEYSKEIKDYLSSLRVCEVEIPDKLFNFIDKHFPSNKVRYRRDFPKFLDFVRAKTIFNQAIRRKHKENILRATSEDYNSARDVFMNAYSKLSDIPLKDVPKRIIKVLEEEKKPLSAREICEYLNGYISIQNLYPHLNDLMFKEIIEEIMDRGEFDKPTTKYLLSSEYKDKKPFKLPIYEDE